MPDAMKSTHYVEWSMKAADQQTYTYRSPHMPRPDAEALAAAKLRDGAVSARLLEVGAIQG